MEHKKHIAWRYTCGVVLGLVLIAGLVALLMDVMEQHVAHAQVISRGASWQGKPVGVMEQAQASPAASDGFIPVNTVTISAP
ncbi:MAG: hypothetical protein KBT18_09615 [Comamonas sp.]|nr:hypothetical protein [Candidatus Comamonas equi]